MPAFGQAYNYYNNSYGVESYHSAFYFSRYNGDNVSYGNNYNHNYGYYARTIVDESIYSLRGGTYSYYISSFNPSYDVSKISYTQVYGGFNQDEQKLFDASFRNYGAYNGNYLTYYSNRLESYYSQSSYSSGGYYYIYNYNSGYSPRNYNPMYTINSLLTYYVNGMYGYVLHNSY